MDNTSTGVMDIGEAVEAAFSAASPPDAAASTPPATPAEAASQPAQETSAQTDPTVTTDPPKHEPFVPFERFDQVNKSDQARKKELEALAWAKDVRPEDVEHLVGMYRSLASNPFDTFVRGLAALKDDPVYGPQYVSWLARELGSRRAPPATVEDQEPQPDIDFGNGLTGFSAKQQAKREAWFRSQLERDFSQKLQPLTEAEQRRAGHEKASQIQADSKAAGIQEVQQMREQYPFFKDHEKDIKAAMLADESLSLKDAFLKVIATKVAPANGAQKAAQLQHKVAANTANPSRPSGASTGPPKTFREGLEAAFSR